MPSLAFFAYIYLLDNSTGLSEAVTILSQINSRWTQESSGSLYLSVVMVAPFLSTQYHTRVVPRKSPVDLPADEPEVIYKGHLNAAATRRRTRGGYNNDGLVASWTYA
ncbi:hypothetical protein BDZ94DRAFT_1303223 [Collybia nuda]|uniref:Uncharacterized protein n=1 Tax=Collybia nuda TaxID=64659 RepID=A0A9P5YIH1_9AGAR|nr:hypothetical protein BDZ94DRAFT_1303223 [Collybia nuda]